MFSHTSLLGHTGSVQASATQLWCSDRPPFRDSRDLPGMISPQGYTSLQSYLLWSGYHSIINTSPPFGEGPFGPRRACLGSTQTSHKIEAWSTHLLPIHPCPRTQALQLHSAPSHVCRSTESLCALTCHGTLGSQSSLCNSGCRIISR